jgi:hypothetical protein
MTPAELRALVESTVDRQQEWIEALILEKLGFNWDIISYGSEGTKSVVFQQPYGSGVTDIDVRIKVFNASGEDIGGQIDESSINNVGFDVYVDEACTLMYIAFEPKATVPL